ncbi:hypothetical protein K469DRAFT_700987 [Zopfia rhizophila CBS 207.26]|uniref:Uncharacterized protein n=1 Tax=Zopfia rhizophila CBS 207.26 TaxID=1314779 RepID=A0A6A6EFX1_9PEZI|nr:hypothetical protein K469DRAFT_700987 [Zopfia rhizophila CBS 207.26]
MAGRSPIASLAVYVKPASTLTYQVCMYDFSLHAFMQLTRSTLRSSVDSNINIEIVGVAIYEAGWWRGTRGG